MQRDLKPNALTTAQVFLVRPSWNLKQSRQDYLARLAEANLLGGISEVCRALGTSFGALMIAPNAGFADVIFRGAQIRWGELRHPRRDFGSSGHLGLGKRAWVCADCIREEMPILSNVNYALALRCEVHKAILFEQCPNCSKPFSYLRPRRNLCPCGADIRQFVTAASPPWIDAFYSKFAPCRIGPGNGEDANPHHEFMVCSALHVLIGLGTSKTYHLSMKAAPELAFLSANWPENFASVLTKSLFSPEKKWKAERVMEQLIEPGLKEVSRVVIEASKALNHN